MADLNLPTTVLYVFHSHSPDDRSGLMITVDCLRNTDAGCAVAVWPGMGRHDTGWDCHHTVSQKTSTTLSQGSRAMRSEFWYVSKFTAAPRGFHCDSNAFEVNNSINHCKITVLNTSMLLPLNLLFDSIVCADNSC